MFLRLGLKNSLRQVSRSILVLLCMVLAAMSLTSALSFSEGKARDSFHFYRTFLGGDILVSPVRWMGQHAQDATGADQMIQSRLGITGLNRLESFYPELYSQGFLTAPNLTVRQAFTEQELEQLREHPGVLGVTVHTQLPVEMTSLWLPAEHYSSFTVLPLPKAELLESRDEKGFQIPFDLSEYRQGNVPLVWVNNFVDVPWATMAEATAKLQALDQAYWDYVQPTEVQLERIVRQQVQQEAQLPRAGERVSLLFPSLRRSPDGQYVADYENTVRLEMEVAGRVFMPTRSLIWPGSQGLESETAYLHASHLYVSPETLQLIWQLVAGNAQMPLNNVTLQVDMSQLKPMMVSLRKQFPQFTFVDVEEFSNRMEVTSRLDFFYRAPSIVYSPDKNATLTMPTELGPVMGLLFFLIAGLLMTSRMLTGAAARRTEIGILKTLGARRRDVVTMALAEALVIAAIGSSIGFMLVRLGGLLVEVSNGVAWSAILSRTAREGVMVVSLASLTALLFAIVPALRLANLTVMRVLRGE